MTKAEAIHAFFSGFGIPAYEEHSVPVWLDDAQTVENKPPYITYELAEGDFFSGAVFITANVWSRSDSWEPANRKAAEIGNAVGRFARLICDDGVICVTKGSPFAQSFSDGICKRKVLNLTLHYITR
jgi:hypothetical protein